MAHKQLLELIRRSLVSNAGDLRFPIKLSFVLTNRCNAKCLMCNIWKKDTADEFGIEEIDRFFSNSGKFSWIDISGGEVFLRDDVVDVARSAAHHCRSLYLLHFATNGLLPEKIIPAMEKILRLKIPKVLMTVSLDGYRELHDKIRGVPGGFDKAIKTYNELQKFNGPSFKVFIGMTLIEDNFREVERSIHSFGEQVNGFSYDDLHVNIAQRSGHYYDNSELSLPDPHKLYAAVESIRNKRRFNFTSPVAYLENRYLKGAAEFLRTKRCPEKCQSLSVSCFMDPKGNIYPCNTYGRLIANVRDFNFSLEKLLASEEARRLRAEIKKGLCPHCWTPCEAYQTIIANFLGFRRFCK